MDFKFNVHLTDADYLDYNVFWSIKSPYGRKQMRSFRILIGAAILLFSLVILIRDNFSSGAFISADDVIAVLGIAQERKEGK